MEFIKANQDDGHMLADIRAAAMKSSLEALGRYDEMRVRSRFLDSFVPSDTVKLVSDSSTFGFYVLRDKRNHFYLDHLYIGPSFQGRELGKAVLERVKKEALAKSYMIRLGALKGSKANSFYQSNGFTKTHEDEFDIYYEWAPTN